MRVVACRNQHESVNKAAKFLRRGGTGCLSVGGTRNVSRVTIVTQGGPIRHMSNEIFLHGLIQSFSVFNYSFKTTLLTIGGQTMAVLTCFIGIDCVFYIFFFLFINALI